MAQRHFSHPLRILVIANSKRPQKDGTNTNNILLLLYFLLLSSCLHSAELKRIDDGGVTVPHRVHPDHPETFSSSPPFEHPDFESGTGGHGGGSGDTVLHHNSNPFLSIGGYGSGGGGGGQGQGQRHVQKISSQDQLEPHPPNRIIAIRNRPFRLRCPIRIESDVRILGLWWIKDDVRLNLNQQQQQQQQQQQHTTSAQDPQQQQQQPQPGGRIKLIGKDLFFEKIVHKIGSSNQNQNVGGRGGVGSSGSLGTTTTTATATGPASGSGSGPVLGAVGRHRNYSDEGNYRCALKSADGVVLSPLINLAVAGLEVQEGVSSNSGKVGEWLILRCPIRSLPHPNVIWTRMLDGLESNISLSQGLIHSRYKPLSSGTLLISNLQLNDSGSYRCTARNEVLKNRERKAEVLLTVSPSQVPTLTDERTVVDTGTTTGTSELAPYFLPTFEASHVVLEEDQDFTLDCIAYGVPLPSITWVFTFLYENETGGYPVSTIISDGKTGHDTIYLTPQNSTLTANYTCVVSNGVGLPISKTMQVSRFPILLKSMDSQHYPPAKTVRFECRVPSPFYLLWYKDGQLLETGRGRVKTRGNELVISNTIRNDSGFYQCEVLGDELVYSIGTARLLVESGREQPNAPVDLQCRVESSKTISVTWKSPNGGDKADVKAYTIHYTAAGSEERQQVTTNTTFLIAVLKPHTNYSIYVRSYSWKSASAQSQRVNCITQEDVPISYPTPLQFERVGPATQARVRWRPLSNELARGFVTLYKIQWRPIDGSFINVRYLDGRFHEFLITDLMVNQSYEMRIIPSTSVGYPVEKDLIPWTGIPQVSLNDPSSWSGGSNEGGANPPEPHLINPHPHNGGTIPTDSSTPPPPLPPHTATNTTTTTPGVTSPAPPVLGPGHNSTNVNHRVSSSSTTNPAEIYSPPSVHLTGLNATAVLVHWTEPPSRLHRSNVTPKGFRISYATFLPRIDDLVTYGPFHIVGYDIREYILTDFAPGTSYEVSVQTFGEGWESDVATKSIRTFSMSSVASVTGGHEDDLLVGELPIIYNLKAYPLSSTEIRLTWDTPFVNESETDGFYRIKYNRVDSNDFHFIRSGRETVDIKDLSPFTAYEFVVRFDPETDVEGPFSQKVESRTLVGKPGPPAGVDWKVTSNSTIKLTWVAPLEPNGLIQQYWVEYKNKTSESQEFKTQSITYNIPSPINESSTNPQQQQQQHQQSDFRTSDGVLGWTAAATNTTSMLLQNLTPSQVYVVRVRAETRAGVGEPTNPVDIRIFLHPKPTGPPHEHQPSVKDEVEAMQDDPHHGFFGPGNKQHLGVILGAALGICCIVICATIIVFRNRCFPFLSRSSRHPTNYVNGNGHGPSRWKRSLESLNGVEMKTLQSLTANEDHIDTKGGHPITNGLIPGPNQDGVSDPLLMRIVRNPIEQRQHELELDVQIRSNCIR